ncbi:hypothetical protein N7467_010272 [Penicillium canescens]|nr:hypothetical protein N7467_010272 [Penicillium canescens]
MRLGFICALFMGAAIAIPHGGAQEHQKGMQQPTSSSASMSMSVPMKRASSTTHTTPTTPTASMEAQKRMLPYEYELL